LKQSILNFAQDRKYFQISQLKALLTSRNISFAEDSIKKIVYYLKKEGKIFSAGRGWYSTIDHPFVLDKKPVQEIVDYLDKEFPLMYFSCWSTEQLKLFYHHIQVRFVIFIYSETDYHPSIYERLRHKYSSVYLNPGKRDVESAFIFDHKTVIIRPSISEEPQVNHYATIEKILVDLFIEGKKLQLLDEWEYQQVFQKIVDNYRVNMAKLIRYANRRNVKKEMLSIIH